MKYGLLGWLLLTGPFWGILTWVRERNTAVVAGAGAYVRGDAPRAAAYFSAALAARARPKPDPHLLLDLGHAQLRAGQQSAARATYARLLGPVPAPVGSAARQQLALLAVERGDAAQGLSLLRQALLLDPTNAGARYNYEVLSQYLAQSNATPKIPTPPPPPKPNSAPAKEKPADKKAGGSSPNPAEKPGTDRSGEVSDPDAAGSQPPQSRPGAPNPASDPSSDAAPGSNGFNGPVPGNGTSQPVASGNTPGSQRGLDRAGASGPGGASGKGPGGAAAAPIDQMLQTQRERLEAMNLTPAQARQLLETMRAQERQYLQQLPSPAKKKPEPGKPTW